MPIEEELKYFDSGVSFHRSELINPSRNNEIAKAREIFKRNESEGGRGPNKKMHPLAEAFVRIDHEKEQSGGKLQSSKDLVILGSLGHNVQLLKNNNVEGYKERVERLWTKDRRTFTSYAFELNVAALHNQYGRATQFVEETGSKSPDLLVDEDVEVECKSLRQLTKRDEHNQEMCSQLQRKIFSQTSKDNGWYIELELQNKISQSDIDWVMSSLTKAQQSGDEKCLKEKNRNLRITPLNPIQGDINSVVQNVPTDSPSKESFDVYKIEMTAKKVNGELQPHSAYIFAFRTTEEPDWEKKLCRIFKKARTQFSGKRPAVLFIELPDIKPETKDKMKDQVSKSVKEELQMTSRISAVAISFLEEDIIEGARKFYQKNEFERNPIAAMSVPTAKSYFSHQ